MHPAHAQSLVDAWEEKQKREEYRHAVLQFTIAQWSGNVRKGVKLKLSDFLPAKFRKAKPEDPELIEARLKIRLNALAKNNQNG